jgi:uncharacterized protein YndB with AHSA1/START domain
MEKIERELLVEAPAGAVWEAITRDGWLADEVAFEMWPGGEARFRDAAGKERQGWVEDVHAPERLTFWWEVDGQPATRVELTVRESSDGITRLRVVETRPLEVLDLVGIPLPGSGGKTYGPALLAA